MYLKKLKAIKSYTSLSSLQNKRLNLQCISMTKLCHEKKKNKESIALLGGVHCLLMKYVNKWLDP